MQNLAACQRIVNGRLAWCSIDQLMELAGLSVASAVATEFPKLRRIAIIAGSPTLPCWYRVCCLRAEVRVTFQVREITEVTVWSRRGISITSDSNRP